MKIFDQRGENLREIKSVMVTGNYNKNNYIQNVFWARGIDEDSYIEQPLGGYDTNTRAKEVLAEITAAFERGDAVYRMPKE